jgi:hypothetical protein
LGPRGFGEHELLVDGVGDGLGPLGGFDCLPEGLGVCEGFGARPLLR